MKTGTVLIFGLGTAAALVAANFVSKAKNAEKLDIGLQKVSINKKKTDLTKTGLDIVISIYNPTDSNIRFEKFYGNVYLDNRRITDIDPAPMTKVIVLEPRTTKLIPLSISVKNVSMGIEVFTRLLESIRTGLPFRYDGTVRLDGRIFAEGIAIPYNLSQKISEL